MIDFELQRRAAALTAVLLLACMFVFYKTARVTPATVNDTSAESAQQTKTRVQDSGRDQVLPMITAAIRDNDFGKARQLASRLSNEGNRAQLFSVVKAAEQNHEVHAIASEITTARFEDARAAATGIADGRVRDEMSQIIDFAEGRHALIDQDAVTASAAIGRLRPGVKRALLLIGSAAQSEAAGRRAVSLAALKLALADVGEAAPGNRRQLLVMISRILVQVDREAGLDVLDRALHERETTAAVSGPVLIGTAGGTFYETLGFGGSRSAFSLAVVGAQGNLQELLIEYHGKLRCTHWDREFPPQQLL